MSSWRVRFEHQHIQSFRSGVHRGGKSRWSCAHDDHVAHLRLVDRLVEAQAIGNLLVGRIPQHRFPAADQHRHVGGGDLKPIEQILNVGIVVEIDVGVRMAVARQKFLDAKRPGTMVRADKHDIAEPVRDQFHPAQDEGPHDDLAELAVGLHERQQVFAVEFDHFARLARRALGPMRGRPESMLTSPVN